MIELTLAEHGVPADGSLSTIKITHTEIVAIAARGSADNESTVYTQGGLMFNVTETVAEVEAAIAAAAV